MAGRPQMNEWLKQELETASAEFLRAWRELESGTLDLAARDLSRHQFDYWTGYANAITNALHELTGMDNE